MSAVWPDAVTRDLQHRLIAWIEAAPAGFVRHAADAATSYGLDTATFAVLESGFEALAQELFAYQFERVPVYRRWCEAVGRTPATVHRSVDIPALPVEAFRDAEIRGFPAAFEVGRFITSGTSSTQRGTLHLDDLSLYETSVLRSFRHHVLPERHRIRMVSLIPDAREAPLSSLSHMIEILRQHCGTAASACFMRGGSLQVDALQHHLQRLASDGEAVLLLGTAFAWVQFLDACRDNAWSTALAPGSRLFETGGYKGRARQLTRAELLAAVTQRLGIPPTSVVGEYGMTELASQYYTLHLRQSLLRQDRTPHADTAEFAMAQDDVAQDDVTAPLWSFPAWLQPRLWTASQEHPGPVAASRGLGLLSHQDLANRCSVAHLLTADLGQRQYASFGLRGRAPAADLRGCGLSHETLGPEVA